MDTSEYDHVTPCRTKLAHGLSGKEGFQCRLALQSLRESGDNKTPRARAPKEGPGEKTPGRPAGKGKFSGQTIHSLTEKNPRRGGTHGYKSFEIILRAGGKITYEDYKERGGRNNDLQWDIDHKFVEVK